MFLKNKKVEILNKGIEKLNKMLTEANFHELLYVLGNKKEIIKRNLLAGIFRGIGIGIGITIISAALIIFLQKLIKLNIPVIGDYITDIVNIVQKNL